MNNIYVDELPKKCWDCKHLRDRAECGLYCRLDAFDEDYDYTVGVRHKNCPLKPLTDRLAEERNKVVQEIKKVLDNKASYSTDADDDWLIQIKESSLYELLDQIEGASDE